MRIRPIIAFLAILVTIPPAGAAVFGTQQYGDISPEEWALRAPTTYSNSDAIVIFDKGYVVAELSGLELKRHVRTVFFNDAGITALTPVTIETREYDGIDQVHATVHKRSGEVIEVGAGDIVETSDKEFRSVKISFPGLEAGDIVEYAYRIRYYGGVDKLGSEKYFLFSQAIAWQWLKEREDYQVEWDEDLFKNITNIPIWYFDHPVYTAYSELEVKLGAALDYICLPTGMSVDKMRPVTRRGSGIIDRVYKYHKWVLEDIPPGVPDPYAYRPGDYRPALHFQLFSTDGENSIITGIYGDRQWRSTGRNMQGYLNMYTRKNPRGLKADALGIVAGKEADRERVEALYEHVRDEYERDTWKYELRPSHKYLHDFVKKRRGSPAEFNILLIEMIRAVEIDAWPVLISTRGEFNFRLTNRFNHLIVFVEMDDGWAYLDASSPACPFGVLPAAARVNEGLLVDYGDSEIDKIALTDPNTFRFDSITLKVETDHRSGQAHIVCRQGGYLAMEALEYLRRTAEDDPPDSLPTALRGLDELLNRAWKRNDAGELVIEGDYRFDDAAGSATDLRPHLWPALMDHPFAMPVRLQPVDLVYPFEYSATLSLESVNSTPFENIPTDTTFGIPGAECRLEVTGGAGRPVIRYRVGFAKAEFTLVEYTDLRRFFYDLGDILVVPTMRE